MGIEKIERIALRWMVKPAFLRDIYYILTTDPRFYSLRGGYRYQSMSTYLWNEYKVQINVAQLKYLVRQVKRK